LQCSVFFQGAEDGLLNKQVMEFPVVMLVRFWANHHLLDLVQRPLWRVVKGRSRTYVDKIVAGGINCQLSGCCSLKCWRSPCDQAVGIIE
jgi:predicted NAD/FAD-binding protein